MKPYSVSDCPISADSSGYGNAKMRNFNKNVCHFSMLSLPPTLLLPKGKYETVMLCQTFEFFSLSFLFSEFGCQGMRPLRGRSNSCEVVVKTAAPKKQQAKKRALTLPKVTQTEVTTWFGQVRFDNDRGEDTKLFTAVNNISIRSSCPHYPMNGKNKQRNAPPLVLSTGLRFACLHF